VIHTRLVHQFPDLQLANLHTRFMVVLFAIEQPVVTVEGHAGTDMHGPRRVNGSGGHERARRWPGSPGWTPPTVFASRHAAWPTCRGAGRFIAVRRKSRDSIAISAPSSSKGPTATSTRAAGGRSVSVTAGARKSRRALPRLPARPGGGRAGAGREPGQAVSRRPRGGPRWLRTRPGRRRRSRRTRPAPRPGGSPPRQAGSPPPWRSSHPRPFHLGGRHTGSRAGSHLRRGSHRAGRSGGGDRAAPLRARPHAERDHPRLPPRPLTLGRTGAVPLLPPGSDRPGGLAQR
jgi:hypothetical protein